MASTHPIEIRRAGLGERLVDVVAWFPVLAQETVGELARLCRLVQHTLIVDSANLHDCCLRDEARGLPLSFDLIEWRFIIRARVFLIDCKRITRRVPIMKNASFNYIVYNYTPGNESKVSIIVK